jgi:hypothetical protein
MPEPKYRRPLNQTQINILLLLYRFRFTTIELLNDYLGITDSKYNYMRIKTLLDQKLIDRHYSGQDKIHGRYATYYLQPKGLKALTSVPGVSQDVLPDLYRDHRAHQGFIETCLLVLRCHNDLKRLYGAKMQFYSKTELRDYDFFPKTPPTAYLMIDNKPYLLEFLPSNTTYPAIRGRLAQLMEHYQSGIWAKSGVAYPTVLFICDTPYIERSVRRIGLRTIYKADVDPDDFPVNTTTFRALFGASNTAIWTNIDDPEELIVL